MSDLISRQAAIDALTTECSWTFYDEHGQLTPNGEEILGTLKKIPSVDAVEVVRCKDCIHFDGECCDRYADETLGYSHSTQPNFFCACGERKTDG